MDERIRYIRINKYYSLPLFDYSKQYDNSRKAKLFSILFSDIHFFGIYLGSLNNFKKHIFLGKVVYETEMKCLITDDYFLKKEFHKYLPDPKPNIDYFRRIYDKIEREYKYVKDTEYLKDFQSIGSLFEIIYEKNKTDIDNLSELYSEWDMIQV